MRISIKIILIIHINLICFIFEGDLRKSLVGLRLWMEGWNDTDQLQREKLLVCTENSPGWLGQFKLTPSLEPAAAIHQEY